MSTRIETDKISASDELPQRELNISSRGKQRILDHAPYLACIILVTLAVRIIPYTESSFLNGNAVVIDGDACYHLRRGELFRHNFPELPIFDSYLNHPYGAFPIWPPLYDFLLAGLWSLLDLIGFHSPLTGLLFLPPVLMVLSCAVVYRIGLRLWPQQKWLACGAALVPAVLPLTVSYSYLGNLDHHAAEMLGVALFIDTFTAGLISLRKHRGTKNIFSAVWRPGLILGFGLLVEHGLLILETFILLSLLLLHFKRRTASLWLFGGLLNAVAGLIILPFGLYGTIQGIHFTHSHFGLFHSLVLVGVTIFFLTLWIIALPSDRLRRSYRMCIAGTGVILVLVLAAVLLHEVTAGAGYLAGTSSGWLAIIGETTSFLRVPLKSALSLLFSEVSFLILLLPVFWWLSSRHRHKISTPYWILLSCSLVFVGLGLQQVRFLIYLSLIAGLVLASVVEALMRKSTPAVQTIAFASILLIGYIPCFGKIGAKDLLLMTGFKDTYPVLQWLQEESPATSNYLHPDRPAEYGVLAEWSLGHYIKYYGHRPVLADNFGGHSSDPRRLNRFFFATDNDETYTFLDENKVRYILCRDLPSMFQSMILGKSMWEYVSNFDKFTGRITFNEKIYPTVLCRLVWRYGAAFIDREKNIYHPPLDRLRLVAESAGKDETMSTPEVARIKLFEYVPGARLLVTGFPPEAGIALSAKIITPHRRTFPYDQLLHADTNGYLSATLPYPTERGKGPAQGDRPSRNGDPASRPRPGPPRTSPPAVVASGASALVGSSGSHIQTVPE